MIPHWMLAIPTWWLVFSGKELVVSWRIATDPRKTEDEYGIILLNLLATGNLRADQVEAVVAASVVPLLPVWKNWPASIFSRSR